MKAKERTKQQLLPPLDMGKRNVILFATGLVILIVGYLLMSIGPWDNPLSRTVSPLVLLIGYLVVFPLAIFARGGRKQEQRGARHKTTPKG